MKLLAIFVALIAGAAEASADFVDTFESYANTDEMLAPGAWGDFFATPAIGTALQAAGGNPGQYAFHPGGLTMKHELTPGLSTSAGQPIVWEFDFLDDGSTSNRRITNGLRVEGTTTILEMGIHNSNLDPEFGNTVAGYAVRTVSIDGSPENWVDFPGNPAIRAGWHHFRATIDPMQILFELDFDSNGVVDATRLITTSDTSAIVWNSLRIGGPSDVSSPLGGAGFDNVSIRIVPEPSAALLVVGGLALRRRRANR